MEDGSMEKEDLEKKAFDFFYNGFCCSEAISKTIVDHFAENPEGYPVRVASGFCGGIGRSHEDICGIFTGGVIAVGYLFGRMEQGKDLSVACDVISEFRESFIETFGSNNCAAILKSLGEQEKYIKCKQITGKATGLLADILVKKYRLLKDPRSSL
jgi:C_GCAxxG_C_C family probable redox protein